MTSEVCAAHAWRIRPADAVRMRSRCNGTGRYGTERKNHQDPAEIPSVPDRSTPVDNRESRVNEDGP